MVSEVYGAHTQNWDATQDNKGIMYFANTYGVLVYDGVSWELIKAKNKGTIRSIKYIKGKGVFVGGVDEFGKIVENEKGELEYQSLVEKVGEGFRDFADVWGVHVEDDIIYIHTRKYLFRWSGDEFKAWDVGANLYHRAFLVNGQLYVRAQGKGLMMLNGDRLELLPGGELFANEFVSALLPYGKNQILIGSRTQGLFLYSKNKSINGYKSSIS